MEITAVIFMIIILTLIWGGFAYSLFIAMKREAKKEE